MLSENFVEGIKIVVLLLVIFLITSVFVGCTQLPINTSEKTNYSADLQTCQNVAENYSAALRAVEKGAGESFRAGSVSAGITKIFHAAGISLTVWPIVAIGYGASGALEGYANGLRERERIVRECLRDSGHVVY